MIPIIVKIDVPEGIYCCTCDHITSSGDFRSCIIFRVPIKCDSNYYLKCSECLKSQQKQDNGAEGVGR